MSDSTSTSQSSASSAAPFGELQNLKLSGKGYSFDGPDPILELQERIEAIEAHIGMDRPLPSVQKALELMGVKTEDVGRVFSEHRPPKLQQRIEAIEARHLREDEETAYAMNKPPVVALSFLRLAGVAEERIVEAEEKWGIRPRTQPPSWIARAKRKLFLWLTSKRSATAVIASSREGAAV